MMRPPLIALFIVVCLTLTALGAVEFSLIQSFPLDCRPWKAACADFDGDGDIDTAIATESAGSAILWRHDGGPSGGSQGI